MSDKTPTELREAIENKLYHLVMSVEPDQDGQSQFDSEYQQEENSQEAVKVTTAKLMALIEATVNEVIGADIQKTREVEGSPVAMYYVNKRLDEQRAHLSRLAGGEK